jgi:hypothetical protein
MFKEIQEKEIPLFMHCEKLCSSAALVSAK